jgi:Secretion system C-terminal sorting domain
MKRLILHNAIVSTTFLCLFHLFFSTNAYSQSETHNMVTYDTVINYSAYTGSFIWRLRITRPVNMFTPGSPDTASRPAIITMPGAGEVGSGAASDTDFLVRYGPHYWLTQGWDGSVQLGDGTHYPILITVIQGTTNTRGSATRALLDTLLSRYHIKRNSVHLGGLSEGGWVWGTMIQYSATAGDDFAASLVTSFVNLEGVAANNSFAPGPTWPTGYGHWAKKYNGKGFFLYGRTDDQDQNTSNPPLSGYNAVVNMNDSVPGSCFVSYEEIDGNGSHCCWNSMYDPSYTTWLTGPNVSSKPGFPNVTGDYSEPSSIFQWMLRQGDTSLVGGAPVLPQPKINVRLYAGTAPFLNSQWNNWDIGTGTPPHPASSGLLKYADGSSSTVSAVLSTQVSLADNGASYSTGATMCPDTVLRFTSYGQTSRTLTFQGLDSTKAYNLSFYASRLRTDGQHTLFTVGSQTDTVLTDYNFTNAALFSAVPATHGTIVVTINNLTTFSYLNGFTIADTTTGGSPSAVEPAAKTAVAGAITDYSTSGITIFPNPVHDNLTISNGSGSLVVVKLFNMSGNLLSEYEGVFAQHQMSLGQLAKGTYIVVVSNKTGTTLNRQVVIKL